MNIVVEKAKIEDKSAILELLKQANMHNIPSPEMPQLTYENYFVAKWQGQIIGFCGYKILSKTTAKTELMVVDRTYRGQGIGYKLQVTRMEDMYNKGIRKLITNADLPATIKWYKKHFGYEKMGELKKLHEFGDPNIDCWTTLQVDLDMWAQEKRKESGS